jgi:acyl carrier protein
MAGSDEKVMSDLNAEIKQAIVRALRLPMAPEDIQDDVPLYGPDGLGLDSIDVLELVLELERSFGVKITDEATGAKVLRSVNVIASYVEAQRQAS